MLVHQQHQTTNNDHATLSSKQETTIIRTDPTKVPDNSAAKMSRWLASNARGSTVVRVITAAE